MLDWHFTDRYYHTNFDTPDKTSAEEMRNVGVAVGVAAWLLASADEATAIDVAELVADAGGHASRSRRREGAKLAAADQRSGRGTSARSARSSPRGEVVRRSGPKR